MSDDAWLGTGSSRDAVAALLEARHGDPFAVLGPQRVGRGRVVRVLRPDAGTVDVVGRNGKVLARLEPLAPGFFAGRVRGLGTVPDYRLRLDGAREIEDPYRFGPVLGEPDLHQFAQGTHWRAWRVLGAHSRTVDGVDGTAFAVWAPHAVRVGVVGPFVDWDGRILPMRRRVEAGVWELFVPGVGHGDPYGFELLGAGGERLPRADPYGRWSGTAPDTASRVRRDAPFAWTDDAWLAQRLARQFREAPVSIYEVHADSWRHGADGVPPDWHGLARTLLPYVADLGFTHVELMTESGHPRGASRGGPPPGPYAPAARRGDPDALRAFVDRAHALGIGVILDWSAAHVPTEANGLARFDGTPLYERADPRVGGDAGRSTPVYDYGRPEVSNFLIANALYWLHEFHVDGLRVDAVASMLHLDHGRPAGAWRPNAHGGSEDLDAVAFLARLNTKVHEEVPGAVTIADGSASWPGVTRPTWLGGLGFGYAWNRGWTNDTLRYVSHDPVHRSWHHANLTLGLVHAFSENFVLPLPHDEVAHGRRSLLGKMPGDDWQRFANLRACLAFAWLSPGKKLLFMGGEFGVRREWDPDRPLEWALLDDPEHGARHRGLRDWVRDLNALYARLPALHALDCESRGFEWVDANDSAHSVVSFLRNGPDPSDTVLVVCNFTPVVRRGYRVGVPRAGHWREVLNGDALDYGGSGVGNLGGVHAEARSWHGRPFSVSLTLPPLAAVVLRPEAATVEPVPSGGPRAREAAEADDASDTAPAAPAARVADDEDETTTASDGRDAIGARPGGPA